MSDRRLRELERAWNESGSTQDQRRYELELKRAGLPRLVIRHYVTVEEHGHCGPDGEFDIEFKFDGGWPIRPNTINAACSVELWPRNAQAAARGWAQTLKKVYYTEDPALVTCKTCIGSINKPAVRLYKREHYAPGSGLAPGSAVAVCGRDDSHRFEETFSHSMRGVTCPACKRIMKKGRRSPRRPAAVKFRVPGVLDGMPGGNFPVDG